MAVYFVDFVNGLDANNGLGPDASHASNKPWKTLAKLLGAAGMASGDTAYLSPAGPFREVVTVAMTSAVAETSIIGDPGNAQGFKTSGGVLVAPADVIWTAYTTNDTSAPSGTVVLNLAGRDFLTFQNIVFVGGSAAAPSCISGNTTNSINITIRDCAFLNAAVAQTIAYTGLADVAANWLIERCVILTFNNASITITLPTSASADYDSNFAIQNCLFLQASSNAINVTASGALSFKGGGVDVLNCTIFGAGTLLIANNANLSTSIPCTAYDSTTIIGTGAALNANTAGQIIGDFNRRIGSTTLTNVTAGANDQSGTIHAPLLEIGQALLMGRMLRPFMSPMLGSPLLGFGNQSGAPTVDFANRPRPAGGGSTSSVAATTGTATAGAATTLTDGGASWTVNAFTGFTVKLTGGTGSGQQRVVTSNTATVLTVPTWTTTPDATSVYSIYHPGKDAAVGYIERHDTAAQETSVVQTGSSGIKITGPGDHDVLIPVDASSTTISIYVRYDTNHGTGSKPQVILLANGSIGVTTETKTATVGVDTWELVTMSAFTPTAKGVVTLRLVSRAAAGNGIAYFDTAGVA